tara:strand:+ start:291 stop:1172 length:882 start_codon:yes stop_codon:yes gene_type:complete
MGLLDGTTAASYYGSSNLGNYQFTSLEDIIDAFQVIYVGEGKLIEKASRLDIIFHAKRALQELSFDTFKSIKAYEIVVPSTLKMPLPQDYVNYVKLTRVDQAGIELVLYPARITSNPSNIAQTATPGVAPFYEFTGDELVLKTDSDTWDAYDSHTPSANQSVYNDDTWDYIDGSRFGLDPQYSQTNGSFYIDDIRGFIHFSSNINGSTLTLKYISDSLGTNAEMRVHKFAEEAMYKHIAYAIVSNKIPFPEYVVQRLRKEKIAATRKAKLRLSNIKLEEITQVLRGSSKHIKH